MIILIDSSGLYTQKEILEKELKLRPDIPGEGSKHGQHIMIIIMVSTIILTQLGTLFS